MATAHSIYPFDRRKAPGLTRVLGPVIVPRTSPRRRNRPRVSPPEAHPRTDVLVVIPCVAQGLLHSIFVDRSDAPGA